MTALPKAPSPPALDLAVRWPCRLAWKRGRHSEEGKDLYWDVMSPWTTGGSEGEEEEAEWTLGGQLAVPSMGA